MRRPSRISTGAQGHRLSSSDVSQVSPAAAASVPLGGGHLVWSQPGHPCSGQTSTLAILRVRAEPVPVSVGDLLEMQSSRPLLGPAGFEALGMGPGGLNKPSGGSAIPGHPHSIPDRWFLGLQRE